MHKGHDVRDQRASCRSWVVILVLRRLRQEYREPRAILGYPVRACLKDNKNIQNEMWDRMLRSPPSTGSFGRALNPRKTWGEVSVCGMDATIERVKVLEALQGWEEWGSLCS